VGVNGGTGGTVGDVETNVDKAAFPVGSVLALIFVVVGEDDAVAMIGEGTAAACPTSPTVIVGISSTRAFTLVALGVVCPSEDDRLVIDKPAKRLWLGGGSFSPSSMSLVAVAMVDHL
jgi:hypothetical protein